MKILNDIAAFIWGPPILILIVGGGLYLSVRMGFFQLRYLAMILRETFGKMFQKRQQGTGTLSPFQAATAALASSIGAANIVVVPTILFTAGPGAIFWMWIAGLMGQATKFSEIVLGIKYREKNEFGEYIGGPAYYLRKGIGGSIGKVLGFCVAFFFMIEILPSITLQTLSAVGPIENVGQHLGLMPSLVRFVAIGLVFVLVVLVVYGGIERIGRVTERLVPAMASIYLIFAILIILMNADKIWPSFRMIFVGAFRPEAVAGGLVGASIKNAIQKGVARGVYSNEAGMGSAPYAHSGAITDHPARQGMWGVFEVIVDTMIVCTTSALVVLVTGIWNPDITETGAQTLAPVAVERAFHSVFGPIGSIIISICLFLFVLSTIIVIVFYCEKQAEYLFGARVGKAMRFMATFMILLAGFVSFEHAGTFLDLTLGLVVIPNMIGLLLLSREVVELQRDFFQSKKKTQTE